MINKDIVTTIKQFLKDPLKKGKLNIQFGTSVLNPGAGSLRILTVAFDRLF